MARTDVVSNDRLRRAFVDSGRSAASVARRAGYVKLTGPDAGQGDSSAVTKALGLSRNTWGVQRAVTWEKGARICRALDLDPVDVGL